MRDVAAEAYLNPTAVKDNLISTADSTSDPRRWPKADQYPKFDGKLSSDLNQWLYKVDMLQRSYRMPGEEVVNHLQDMLTGTAASGFLSLYRAHRECEWNEWKVVLLEHFGSPARRRVWLKKKEQWYFPDSVSDQRPAEQGTIWISEFVNLCLAVDPLMRLEPFKEIVYDRIPSAFAAILKSWERSDEALDTTTFISYFSEASNDYRSTHGSSSSTSRPNTTFTSNYRRPRYDSRTRASDPPDDHPKDKSQNSGRTRDDGRPIGDFKDRGGSFRPRPRDRDRDTSAAISKPERKPVDPFY